MRLPKWIRARHVHSELRAVKGVLREHGLSTVCEEARCPNKSECFSKPTAAFMILGDICTRNCGFCSVTPGSPLPVDEGEPMRVARASEGLGLRYVVVTSVTRDDLPDGGAGHFARTVRAIRDVLPSSTVEVLIPDFGGMADSLKTVLDSGPDVLNHNVETVPRLYPSVRPGALFERSLRLLRGSKRISPATATKSGLMLGLGETMGEVVDVMRSLRDAGCDCLTIGQYLRPSLRNLPVAEYVLPGAFDELRDTALEMGFKFIQSSPLVRSSMNAEEMRLGEAGRGS